ncbi:MAG: hypothetical protein IPJ58_15400 [Ardenticatenia bacterium]|nr:hypothetical protein [Ardenticatenia bacterium]
MRSRPQAGDGRLVVALLLMLSSLLGLSGTGPARVAAAGLLAPAQDLPAAVVYLPMALRGTGMDQLPSPPSVQPPSATPRPSPTATRPLVVPTLEPTATPSPTTAPPSPTPKQLPWWGAYDEPLTAMASLDNLRSGYRAAAWYTTLLAVLQSRYPTGNAVVSRLKDSQKNAATWVGGQTGSFDALLGRVGLTVHEMDHQLGWQEGILATGLQQYAYVVRSDLTLLVPQMETFPRSEIVPYLKGPLLNMYKPIYLEGDSGKQGFLTVLDEFNAYTHSLFVGYGLRDQTPKGQRQSDRDGLVTFMMYTQFYLRHARTTHPADYARLRAAPEIRQAVKTLWARANFILDVTEDIPSLALDAAAVEAEMRKADMQAELRDFVLK